MMYTAVYFSEEFIQILALGKTNRIAEIGPLLTAEMGGSVKTQIFSPMVYFPVRKQTLGGVATVNGPE